MSNLKKAFARLFPVSRFGWLLVLEFLLMGLLAAGVLFFLYLWIG